MCYIMDRAVPNKRGMGAACAVLGSTFSGLVRYCFGRWIPTFEQLMYSKVKANMSCHDMAPQHHTYPPHTFLIMVSFLSNPRGYIKLLVMWMSGTEHHHGDSPVHASNVLCCTCLN